MCLIQEREKAPQAFIYLYDSPFPQIKFLFLVPDTDSFIIGMNVYVDGVKPGRIQFIGETKFGPGEWAGVFLDEPIGKNDGSVMSTRYFTCEPRHGVFSRLYRLTREPIDCAEEILNQVKR